MATNQAVITESKFDTLPSLLEALSSRSIVGHAALDAIISFLDRFCWSNSQSLFQTINASSPAGSYGKTMATLLSTPRSKLLLKIFDKNLKAGCSVGMIREVSPSLLPGFHVALGHHMPLEKAKTLFDNALSVPESTMESKRKKSSKNASPKIVDKEWFASRKLDGVRCLVRIDRQSGNITAISRNGRPFEGMGMIQESIRSILRMGQSDVVQNRDKFFRQALGLHNATDTLPDTLILDGEMCVFETESQETVSGSPLPVIVGQVENDNLGREKFTKAITYVTRGTVDDRLLGTLEDDDEFDNSISNKQLMEELTITKNREFNERKGSRPLIDRIQAITNALIEANDSQSSDNIVKVMSQTKVSSYKQLEKIVAQGIERGWEGVILRKNVGRNLLKFKEFHDAEFKVVEAILGSMRIAVQGKYEERKVLTSVVVMHRGNRVKVGSGFSAEERVRFGRDPSLIVGKTITVKYFEESKTYLNSGIGNGNDSNGDGATVLSIDPMSERESANGSTGKNSDAAGDETKAVWSLRFPIVKAIYDEGPRQI
ncbi:hypothetical protein FBU30_004949 [Linnemannia zychae]|nr:hypothetical protein FBU30_004949 [Linnemannia zychae]